MTRALLVVLAVAAAAPAEPKVDPHGDPLPDGAIVRFGTLRDRVGAATVRRSHALSSDGRLLAVETPHDTTLWDVDTGKVARRLPWRTHQGDNPMFALSFSPDGKFLARVAGRAVAVWDVTTGKEVFDIDFKEQDKFQAIAYLPGGKRLLVVSEREPRAYTLDARTGEILGTYRFAQKYLWSVAVGKFVLGYLEDGWALFDMEAGTGPIRFPVLERGASLSGWPRTASGPGSPRPAGCGPWTRRPARRWSRRTSLPVGQSGRKSWPCPQTEPWCTWDKGTGPSIAGT